MASHALRRFQRWAWVLAIFALGIPASTALLVRSSGAHGRLRELAIRALQEELGLRATLGRVQLELVPFAVVARDVALDDPVYGRLADASALRIQPSLRALVRGRVDLAAIELDGATVHLLVRDGAIRNLPRIDTGEGGGGPPTLPFRELRVLRSSVEVDGGEAFQGAVRDVRVVVRGGPAHTIEVELEAGEGEITHAAGSDALRRLAARAVIAEDRVEVEELALGLGPLELALRDARMPLPPPTALETLDGIAGHLELDYDLAHLARLRLPFSVPRLEGRVAVRADVTPRPSGGPLATGTLTALDARVEQFGIGERTALTFEATREAVRVTEGDVTLIRDGGHVGLTATLTLDPALTLEAVARPRGLSFARLMHQFDVTPTAIVEWLFDGELHLRGSLRDLDLRGPIDLSTHDFVVSRDAYDVRPVRPVIAIPRGHFVGSWSIGTDAVRFEDLVADLPHSRIEGDVLLGYRNELVVRAETRGDLVEVSPLAGFSIGGVGGGTCTIDGSFHAPDLRGHIDFDDFEFDGMRLGHLASDAVLDRDGQGVTFPHVDAEKRDSRYTVDDLRLDFHHDRFALEGRLGLTRLTLADFYDVFGLESDERFTEYQGLARGTAIVRYTNGYPGDSPSGTLRTDATLDFDTASLSGFAFERGHLEGRFDWLDWSRGMRGAELDVREATLHKGEGTVVLEGRMALGGGLQMSAAATRLALRDLEGIGERWPDVTGTAAALATVSGTAEQMRVDADVTLAGVSLGGRALGDSHTYVRLTHASDPWIASMAADDAAQSEPCAHGRRGLARADWPADPPLRTVDGLVTRLSEPSAFVICGDAFDGDVAIDLAVGRAASLPLRGQVAFASLDLGRLFPSLAQSAAGPIDARTTGNVVLTAGGIRDLEGLGGALALSDLDVRVGDVEVASEGPIRVRLERGGAEIERARLRAPGSTLVLHGGASLERGLGLRVDGEVDLGLVPRVTSAVTAARGALLFELALSGGLADPEVFGEVSIDGASVSTAALAAPVEDLSLRAHLSSRSVQLESLSARLAGGELRMRGEATLERRALSRYDLEIVASHMSFTPAEGLSLTVSANTRLSGAPGAALPDLTGELTLERFDYTRPIGVLGTTLGDLTRAERAEVTRWDPGAEHVRLDVVVTQLAPMRVRNNLADAELSIETEERGFRVVGTDQRMGVLGDLRFDRGRIFFRNSAFDIRPGGTMSFDDEARIDPHFDVHAATEIRRSGDLTAPSWRILLDAEGSRDALRIETHSDPVLPQEDILLLLAVGMTRSELDQLRLGDSGSAYALEALATVTGMDREVRRALPIIDDFRIGSGYSVRTARTEPQVTIGKRIADRVRLSATTSLSESREFRAVVEAQLDDTTSVTVGYDNYNLTSSSSFGNVGADLRWRLEFE